VSDGKGRKVHVTLLGPELEVLEQATHEVPADEDLRVEVRLAHGHALGQMVIVCEVRPVSYKEPQLVPPPSTASGGSAVGESERPIDTPGQEKS